MARKPRRAAARPLVDTFPDPERYPLRHTRRPPKTITHLVGEEALALLSALSARFHPIALTPEGPVFLVDLPEHLLDRLAVLGVDREDCEPSLAWSNAWPNQEFSRHAGAVIDGEVDAGEEPEEQDSDKEPDAGDLPEFDPAEDGIADADALALFHQENPRFRLIGEGI